MSRTKVSSATVNSVREGILTNLGGSAFFGVSGFLFAVLLSTAEGAETSGSFWAALAVYNIVSRSVELGTASGLVRFASKSSARNNHLDMKRYLRVALLPVGAASVVGSGVVAVLAATVFGDEGGADQTLLAFALFVPVAAIYTPIVQSLRGFGSMRSNVLIDRFARGLLQPGSVLLVLAVGGSIAQAALAWGTATLALLVLASRSLAVEITTGIAADRTTPASVDPECRAMGDARSEFWTFTRPRVIGQLSEVMLLWVDVLIVGLVLGDRAAGIYAAVSRFAVVGMFIAEAIMKVAGPRTAALIARGQDREVRDLLAGTAHAQTGIVWPVYLVLIVFAPQVTAWFGPEFVEGALALRILAAGLLVSSLFGPVGGVVLMSGRSSEARTVSLVALGVNVVVTLALIGPIGINGAALAWSASFIVAGAMNARIASIAGFGAPLPLSMKAATRCAAFTGTTAFAAATLLDPQLALVVAALAGIANIVFELGKSQLFSPSQNTRTTTPETATAVRASSL